MSEAVALPNLPGYRVHPAPTSDRAFHKKQGLTFSRGYAVVASPAMPAAGGMTTPAAAPFGPAETLQPPETDGQPFVPSDHLPQWVSNDRKVLHWFGYFREQVSDSTGEEDRRVRHIAVHYYLEDDTVDICEPRQDNSGLLQGMLIKRHRPKKNATDFFAPADFLVGGAFTLYSRDFHIVDADAFTREHMAATAGLQLADKLPYPADPLEHYRAAFGRRTAAPQPQRPSHYCPPAADAGAPLPSASQTLPHESGSRLSQYLENSRKVLRFFCVWDDRNSLQGDRRPYRLHFFLEDDTVEVLEVHEANSGRDAFPVFLRRAKLPKVLASLPPISAISAHSSVGMTPMGANKAADCYRPSDLRLGAAICVHGRRFFLHDCDAFTRQYYQEKLGVSAEDMEAIEIAAPAAPPVPSRTLPPYNGFGSFEDSAQNCISLLPQQPKKNFYNLMQKHRIVLRFGCRFHETPSQLLTPSDRDRKFVLSYFCGDDTLSIFEPPQRNSGITGGKFLERMSVCRPGAGGGSAAGAQDDAGRYYTEQDLAVGAILTIHQRQFELLNADEFTFQFMENNRHQFPQADARAALAALREQGLGPLRQALLEACGGGDLIDFEGFDEVLRAAGHTLIRHQSIALFRALPRPEPEQVSVSELLQYLQSG